MHEPDTRATHHHPFSLKHVQQHRIILIYQMRDQNNIIGYKKHNSVRNKVFTKKKKVVYKVRNIAVYHDGLRFLTK